MQDSSYHLTDHAKQEMVRRGISMEMLNSVLMNPQQVVETHVAQSIPIQINDQC